MPWISTSNMTQKGQKRVYFGPFRPKIDTKMVSYKITFTKNWFFITTFHLFTWIRIILDHQVWDHFSNKRNLNKWIWVFWAPVLEEKSNRILKNMFFLLFGSLSGFSLPYVTYISLSALPLALEYSVPRCGISIKDVVQKPSMIGLKWGNCWRNTILWYTFIDLKVNETLGTL